MACRFPDADDPHALWRNMLDRKVSFRPFGDRWSHDLFYAEGRGSGDTTCSRRGAWLDDVDRFAGAWFGIPPRRAECMDPQQRLLLEVSREALADAGLERRAFAAERSGVFFGVSVSEYSRIMVTRARAYQMTRGEFGEMVPFAAGRVAPSRTFTLSGSLLSMCATEVAQRFNLRGPAVSLDAACASSLAAVAQAAAYLRGLPAGSGAIALAGGAYLNLLPDNAIAFARTGALAREECRPFDAAADGFLLGEGAAVVVLKRLEDAVRDGDRVYSVLRGVGWRGDGPSDSPMTPQQRGQEDALRDAFADGGTDPSTVGYVECHATATAVGDLVELRALASVLNGARPRLGSVKANFGHTLTAAGVAGLVRASLALHHGMVPPQAGFERWHPRLEEVAGRFEIPLQATPWDARCAVVDAFGFGGVNCVAVLERAPGLPAQEVPGPHRFYLSAPSPGLLDAYLGTFIERLPVDLAGAAYTLSLRAPSAYRASFVAGDAAGVAASVAALRAALASPPTGLSEIEPGCILGPDLEPPVVPVARIVDVPVMPLARERYWIVAGR